MCTLVGGHIYATYSFVFFVLGDGHDRGEAPSESGREATAENLVDLFTKSKSGWRPTTNIRQEKQLNLIFTDVAERCEASDPLQIILQKKDIVEDINLLKLPNNPAQVRSMVIALLEFSRFVNVREPQKNATWDAALRRLDVWKRDATYMDSHRQDDIQERMGSDEYLLSKEELRRLLRILTKSFRRWKGRER